jgi:3-hydroxybutyryl-CoA dehydrogenase
MNQILPSSEDRRNFGFNNALSSRVTIIGGGVMGPGIALVFAEGGYDVDICEVSEKAADAAMSSFVENLRVKIELGLTDSNEEEAILARVRCCKGAEVSLATASLVIEAVTENPAIKQQVYQSIADIAPKSAVIWSNTSSLNIFPLAPESLKHRLLIAHWFAPAQILPLVEVVGASDTDSDCLQECCDLLTKLGKKPILLKKFARGFVINRLQRALGREALHLIESGVIDIEELDIAVRTSLAPRMQLLGLLQRMDFAGLGLSLGGYKDKEYDDPPLTVPKSLMDLVEAGNLGVSTGSGFYDYGQRTPLELQRQRDIQLWKIMMNLSDFVADPRPI